MKYFLLFFCSFFLSIVVAQDLKPALSLTQVEFEGENYYARNVKAKLSSRLKKDFDIMPEALFKLSASINFGDVHTINGIDTYKLADVFLQYTIKAEGLKSAKKEFTLRTKAKNEKELKSKLGTNIIRDSKHYKELEIFISNYMSECF